MDAHNVDYLNDLLEQDAEIKDKIREHVTDLDKKTRSMVGILNRIHSTPSESSQVPPLVDAVRPILRSCHGTTAALAGIIPPNQFWRWKEMWSNSLRTAVYAAALVEYLTTGSLISLAQTSETLGVKEEWKDRFCIAVEDYLHGLITMVNELSRLAVNAVTLGDYQAPIRISIFVKDLFAGFTMLNLKNDTLRRRFDSLKYDLKKIEEEIECWSRASKSLATLSNVYASPSTGETIERVNRLIAGWPTDDSPAESYDTLKANFKKLSATLKDVRRHADNEAKALDAAVEHLEILIALRRATEPHPQEKRNKRPRPPSPSPTSVAVTSAGSRAAQLARGSAGLSPAIPFSREPRARREALFNQLPLQEGRKVAFHPPPGKTADGSGADGDENTWILAVITKCIQQDRNRYEVQDVEPQEDGQPGQCYNTTLRSIIPLPDPNAPPNSATHPNAYQEFAAGSTVMALYPDTSCFYRAEVIAAPSDLHPLGRGVSSKHISMYKLRFEDDDDQEHSVLSQFVVEWPGT
ncbi:hypothetical protein ID866_5014 [Astraeus odoratus]|nr:hypothetical protein ID866_5014 [Astraeus odoratus]